MSPAGTGKVENLKADIVIIGSGGGLVAALAAVERGAKDIIVLEKQDILGGNLRLANGFFACESPVQKRANIIDNRDDYFKIAMKWTHCTRIEPRVMRAYINKSGDTIRWLEEKGVEFEDKSLNPNMPRAAHAPVGKGAGMMKVLVRNSEDLGVKSLLGTGGKKILRGPKGNVTGVVAENEKGEEFEIKTGSVIIATGGFTGNTELLRKYCPDYYDTIYVEKWPHHTGDGLLMAAEIGAAIADSIPIYHQGPIYETGSRGGFAAITGRPFTVWVNKRGKRFIDEGGYSLWENGNAILVQPEHIMYTLFDDQIRQDTEGKEPPAGIPGLKEGLQKQTASGSVMISDSWEGIASWIGADPEVLKAEIDEYNSFCDRGHDEIFVKDQRHLLPLRKPPYYAIRCTANCGETMGGIKVNEHMEVLDTQDKIIPGLYVAGVLADGWAGQTYCSDQMGGSAFGFAVNSGRIAGENAAEFISRK